MTTTAHEAQGRHFWLFGLVPRFLVILTPLFLVLALPGIGFLVQYELRADHETLAARIGNIAARAATALSRHDWRGTPSLARDLLAPLIADPAILCADVVAAAGGEVLLAQPPPLGCSGAQPGESLRLPVGGTGEAFLLIRFSAGELKEAERRQSLLAGSVVALSFLLAVLAVTVGFRLIVNRPLRLMMESIRRSTETGDRSRCGGATRSAL